MEESKSKEKKKTPNQIEKELLALQKAVLSDKRETLEIKDQTIDKLLKLAKASQEDDIPADLKVKILKIRTLRETMSFCYGQGPFGAMQETMIRPMFDNDDDGLDFKAKLFELIKSL